MRYFFSSQEIKKICKYIYSKTYLKNQVLSKHGLENGKAPWGLEDA